MTNNVFKLFATPIYLGDCENKEKINDIIDNVDIEKTVKDCTKLTDWKCHVDTDIGRLDIDVSWKQQFFSLIESDIIKYLNQIQSKTEDINISIDYQIPWINVYRPGNFQELHDHLYNSSFSYTYFYKLPENTGNFVFSNPIRSYGPLSGLANKFFDVVTTEFTPEVKEGQILIFPNWLQHLVTENKSSEDRITISGNFGIQKTS